MRKSVQYMYCGLLGTDILSYDIKYVDQGLHD